MKETTKQSQRIIDQYIKSCEIIKETALNGDYKLSNKEGAKTVRLFKLLEKDRELALQTLPTLFTQPNVVVKTKAAAHCIALNIKIDEAERVLKEIANDKTNGIFGFNAEMTLKVWNKQGYIKVYKEQIPRVTRDSSK